DASGAVEVYADLHEPDARPGNPASAVQCRPCPPLPNQPEVNHPVALGRSSFSCSSVICRSPSLLFMSSSLGAPAARPRMARTAAVTAAGPDLFFSLRID